MGKCSEGLCAGKHLVHGLACPHPHMPRCDLTSFATHNVPKSIHNEHNKMFIGRNLFTRNIFIQVICVVCIFTTPQSSRNKYSSLVRRSGILLFLSCPLFVLSCVKCPKQEAKFYANKNKSRVPPNMTTAPPFRKSKPTSTLCCFHPESEPEGMFLSPGNFGGKTLSKFPTRCSKVPAV